MKANIDIAYSTHHRPQHRKPQNYSSMKLKRIQMFVTVFALPSTNTMLYNASFVEIMYTQFYLLLLLLAYPVAPI